MDARSPPSKRRREKENNKGGKDARKTAVRTTRGKQAASEFGPTPFISRRLTIITAGSMPSPVSASTAFQGATTLADCSNLQPRQRLDETTSPRMDSRLARRPKEHFPCSLQPFRIVPPPPGDDQSITVAEANRRLQQARVLSARQQHFDQLIDLASTGYIPERQCAVEQVPAAPAAPPVADAAVIAEPATRAADEVYVPEQEQQDPAETQATALGGRQSLRLLSSSGVTTMPSRSGRGCIRILRME